jgi:hypothetical protein
VSGDTASLTVPLEKTKGVFSEKAMLERFGVDTTIWRVKEMQIKTWRGLIGEGKTVLQDWAFLKLERIISQSDHEKLEGLKAAYLDLAKKHSPKYPKLPKPKRGEFLLEPVFTDTHFGMHSWGLETGQDYDLKIAAQHYRGAGEALYDKLKGYSGVDRVMMPIGNDLLHVDTLNQTTTRGTLQHTDSRPLKAFQVSLESVIWSIDLFMSLAPVDVVIVPGNHATLIEQIAGEYLKAWYRNNNRVTVDNSPSLRKYYTWRTGIIGLTHSDKEKKQKLPNIMNAEARPDLSKILWQEWHTGHTHTSTLDEINGVAIRTISPLVPSDSWHHSQGYVGNRRAAEGLVFSEKGFEASHVGRP